MKVEFASTGAAKSLEDIVLTLTQSQQRLTMRLSSTCTREELTDMGHSLDAGMALVASSWGGPGDWAAFLDAPPCPREEGCHREPGLDSQASFFDFAIEDWAAPQPSAPPPSPPPPEPPPPPSPPPPLAPPSEPPPSPRHPLPCSPSPAPRGPDHHPSAHVAAEGQQKPPSPILRVVEASALLLLSAAACLAALRRRRTGRRFDRVPPSGSEKPKRAKAKGKALKALKAMSVDELVDLMESEGIDRPPDLEKRALVGKIRAARSEKAS